MTEIPDEIMAEIPEELRITGRKMVSLLLHAMFIGPYHLSDVADNIARALLAERNRAYWLGNLDALEKAALIADGFNKSIMSMTVEDVQAMQIAAAIRAMKP